MKKRFFRIISLIVSLTLAICLSSCAKKKADSPVKKEFNPDSAYRAVLEELLAEYGMPSVSGTNFTGLLNFEIVDLNDDGQEELFAICRKGEDNFYSAIYTYENGETVKAWETDSPDAFSKAYIKKQDGKTCVFLTVSYRSWSSGIIVYEDGKFIDLFQGEEYSEEEQKRYDEGAQRGIGEEDDVKVEIHLNRIGLSLENPWEEVMEISTGDEFTGTSGDMKKNYRKIATECKDKLKELGIKQNESAETLMAKIPYYGDRSICKMDADMAKAYAEAIASMDETYISYPGESWSREYELCALLADPAGDGMPILITAYLDKYNDDYTAEDCNQNYGGLYEIHMWGYENGKAIDAKVQQPDYTNGFGIIGGKTYYRSVEFFHDVGHKRAANYYLIENGTITLTHNVDIYDVCGDAGNDESLYGEIPEDATYQMTSSDLAANGWISREEAGSSIVWNLVMYNGNNVTKQYMNSWHDEIVGFSESDEIAHINDLEYHITLHNEDAWSVADILTSYSEV